MNAYLKPIALGFVLLSQTALAQFSSPVINATYSVLVWPANFWTTNSAGIYEAIESLLPEGDSGGTLTNFTATAPLYAAASATNVTLWLTNATASVPGSMSAAHYTKLEALNAANYQPTYSYLTDLSDGTATLVELTATTLNATTYNVSTQNVGTLNITNNVAITYGTSVSNVVDFLKAESLINVGGNITYTHATNGAAGQSITHIVTMPNWSGTTRTLMIPAAWKTNFFSPVPPSLTNGTITTMYVRAINATGDAANQTNVMVSFDHSK